MFFIFPFFSKRHYLCSEKKKTTIVIIDFCINQLLNIPVFPKDSLINVYTTIE